MRKGYPCPCCKYLTLGEKPPGTFEICPICCWEDDYAQYNNPELTGGANKESLTQARKNFLEFAASSKDVLKFVRKPVLEEIPPELMEHDEKVDKLPSCLDDGTG